MYNKTWYTTIPNAGSSEVPLPTIHGSLARVVSFKSLPFGTGSLPLAVLFDGIKGEVNADFTQVVGTGMTVRFLSFQWEI